MKISFKIKNIEGSMSEENDELEYNDGIGDMLKEKELRRFSWAKTGVVLGILVFIIFIGLNYVINYSKSILIEPTETKTAIQSPLNEDKTFQDRIDRINAENKAIISQIETGVNNPEKLQVSEKKETPKVSSTKKAPVAASELKFKVISGTYKSLNIAKHFQETLKAKGFESYIRPIYNESDALFQVQTGAYASKKQAQYLVDQLKKHNIDSYIITR